MILHGLKSQERAHALSDVLTEAFKRAGIADRYATDLVERDGGDGWAVEIIEGRCDLCEQRIHPGRACHAGALLNRPPPPEVDLCWSKGLLAGVYQSAPIVGAVYIVRKKNVPVGRNGRMKDRWVLFERDLATDRESQIGMGRRLLKAAKRDAVWNAQARARKEAPRG